MNQEELKLGCSSLGEFLVKIRKIRDGELKDSRLKTAGHMASETDSQGGFLIPEEWADGIYQAARLENAIVRPRARVFKTTRDSLKIRTLVDTNRSSNIFGGITFTWMTEAQQKSYTSDITKPEVGELELVPHKMVGGCYVSNELENDYGAFGEFMQQSFGAALRFIEDDYFIWGNGAAGGQPLGIMNSGALVTVTRVANNLIDWRDLVNMSERLLPASWENAIWMINPDALDELMEATAPAANQAMVVDLGNRKIMGIPFIISEKCAAIDNTGDIILADWSHYAIADRSIEISGSRHTNTSNVGFISDETFWRVVFRYDGQPTLAAPITPLRGANTLSPFVVLTTNS